MAEKTPARPPRLAATCAYLALIGSYHLIQAIVILTDWYGSGEEQVKRFTDPLVREGFTRGDAETAFRIYLGILAMLAGVVVVFAIYTALGHAASRILVTITAPLMAIVGLGQGSVFSVVVGVIAVMCVVQLWSQPEVRRWFALLAGKEPPPLAATQQPQQPTQQQPAPQEATQWQGHPQAYAQGYPPRPPARRDTVKTLSIIALIGSSLLAVGCGVYLLMYEFAREELVREQLNSGMNWMNLTEAEIRDSMADLAVASWVGLALCLVAVVVSTVLLIRRRGRG